MIKPSWLLIAESQIGIREIKGPRNAPGIMAMISRAKGWLGIAVNNDEVPWCGTFVASCMEAAGFASPRGAIAVRASWWETWGVPTTPRIGAILCFRRPGGGHVAFYVGEDAAAYHVLGGNQSDAVTITRIARNRLAACRWPDGIPITTKPKLASAGGAVSVNEA